MRSALVRRPVSDLTLPKASHRENFVRISLSLFGHEVCAISFGDEGPVLLMDPGTIASQVEHAMPQRIGFHVDTNPSLDE